MWLHLIDGPEKALLVDTGVGIGDLKGLVRHLIGDKPLYVVNTHEHWDHVMGNSQFPAVWCHPRGAEFVRSNYMQPDMWDRFLHSDGRGGEMGYTAEDFIPCRPYELLTCEEGHIFDLGGGHLVEVLHTPGHAPGGLSFLDRKNRILFSGAMHSGNTLITAAEYDTEMSTVESFLESLERLCSRCGDDFDCVYAGHEIVPLERSYIDDEMNVCREIIRDHDCYEFTQPLLGKIFRTHVSGSAGIRFSEDAFRDTIGKV